MQANPATAAPLSSARLSAHRDRLKELDNEVIDLHRKLYLCAQERKSIHGALKSVGYPVAALSRDVLAEIFSHYIDWALIGTSKTMPVIVAGKNRGNGPLVLASVCRAWRAAALSLPFVWSRMDICTRTDFEATEKLLAVWLPRTGTHPLAINLRGSTTSHLLPILAPFSPQLDNLACAMDQISTFPADLIRGRLPNLRKLTVSVYTLMDGVLDAFLDAPLLRDVHIIAFVPGHIDLPWTFLTNLGLSDISVDHCLRFLQLTPQLESLSLCANPEPSSFGGAVRLPNLRTLRCLESHDAKILLYLIAPALRHLELPETIELQDFQERPLQVQGFMERSQCALHSVMFTAHSDIIARLCLAHMPTVVELRFKNIEWSYTQLTHCLDAFKTETFLPNLRELSLAPFTMAVDIQYEKLGEMLAIRRRLGLKSFELVIAPEETILHNPRPDVEDLERGLDALRALKEDGMELRLRGLQNIRADTSAWALYPPVYGASHA
ncbi:hypothetical protein C8F01DRAFT_1255181 [Mycena amicta]|nr:hypothetical protein C8F01DRAFT_1255181 [Mycena amicta]